MILSFLTGSVALASPPGGLPDLGETPRLLQYKRVDEGDGPVRGRWKRSRARYRAWELRNDTIVRLQDTQRGRVMEERRFDATGWPLTTWYSPGTDRSSIEVHTVPSREIGLSGWVPRDVPGGTVLAPLAPFERESGGVELLLLGGIFEVWYDPSSSDVYGADFRSGLLAGCGCVLVDEAATWIDGRPAKRFRLDLPSAQGVSVMDLWALPLRDDRGVWIATYRVTGPRDEILALAPGRAMISTVSLSSLGDLRPPAPPAEPEESDEPTDP